MNDMKQRILKFGSCCTFDEVQQLQKSASVTYLEGLKTIDFRADEIPRFKKVNEKLQSLTQWELVVVPGLIPDRTFFELLSHQKFPATTWLRKKSSLDYLEGTRYVS